MKKPRNIGTIIDRIMEIVPGDDCWDNLRYRLDKVKSDAGFRAPEACNVDWGRLGEVLNDELSDLGDDWMVEVGKIVRDEV